MPWIGRRADAKWNSARHRTNPVSAAAGDQRDDSARRGGVALSLSFRVVYCAFHRHTFAAVGADRVDRLHLSSLRLAIWRRWLVLEQEPRPFVKSTR